MEIEKTVAFTGHRPILLGGYDENNPTAKQVRQLLAEEIGLAIRDGFETFISGGALGVDTWAAEAVLAQGAKLIVAKPFPSQHTKWPAHCRARFFKILAQAQEVVDVSPDPYFAWKMTIRNEWMVDRCSRLIAVYVGHPGGTANCLAYARKKKVDIRLINPGL